MALNTGINCATVEIVTRNVILWEGRALNSPKSRSRLRLVACLFRRRRKVKNQANLGTDR
jgi:hypothetical protein